MERVQSVNFQRLHNEEVNGLLGQVVSHIPEGSLLAERAEFGDLKLALSNYNDALGSGDVEHSKELSGLDKTVDQNWSGLKAHVKNMRNCPDETLRGYSEKIYAVVTKEVKPTNLSYSEQYSVVGRQLEALESLDSAMLEATLTSVWLKGLRKSYDQFVELRKKVVARKAAVVSGKVKEARALLVAAYAKFIEYVNSLSVVKPSEDLDAIICELNVLIDHQKLSLKLRQAKRNSDKETPEEKAAAREQKKAEAEAKAAAREQKKAEAAAKKAAREQKKAEAEAAKKAREEAKKAKTESGNVAEQPASGASNPPASGESPASAEK